MIEIKDEEMHLIDKIKINTRCGTAEINKKLNWTSENKNLKKYLNKKFGKTCEKIQNIDVSEKDFLRKLFYCLICLPENVARQTSFGAGLAGFEKGEVRIAQTKAALGVRKIGGEWRGTTPEDITFGQEYLASLTQSISNCTTPRQVLEAIQNIPEKLRKEIVKLDAEVITPPEEVRAPVVDVSEVLPKAA